MNTINVGDIFVDQDIRRGHDLSAKILNENRSGLNELIIDLELPYPTRNPRFCKVVSLVTTTLSPKRQFNDAAVIFGRRCPINGRLLWNKRKVRFISLETLRRKYWLHYTAKEPQNSNSVVL